MKLKQRASGRIPTKSSPPPEEEYESTSSWESLCIPDKTITESTLNSRLRTLRSFSNSPRSPNISNVRRLDSKDQKARRKSNETEKSAVKSLWKTRSLSRRKEFATTKPDSRDQNMSKGKIGDTAPRRKCTGVSKASALRCSKSANISQKCKANSTAMNTSDLYLKDNIELEASDTVVENIEAGDIFILPDAVSEKSLGNDKSEDVLAVANETEENIEIEELVISEESAEGVEVFVVSNYPRVENCCAQCASTDHCAGNFDDIGVMCDGITTSSDGEFTPTASCGTNVDNISVQLSETSCSANVENDTEIVPAASGDINSVSSEVSEESNDVIFLNEILKTAVPNENSVPSALDGTKIVPTKSVGTGHVLSDNANKCTAAGNRNNPIIIDEGSTRGEKTGDLDVIEIYISSAESDNGEDINSLSNEDCSKILLPISHGPSKSHTKKLNQSNVKGPFLSKSSADTRVVSSDVDCDAETPFRSSTCLPPSREIVNVPSSENKTCILTVSDGSSILQHSDGRNEMGNTVDVDVSDGQGAVNAPDGDLIASEVMRLLHYLSECVENASKEAPGAGDDKDSSIVVTSNLKVSVEKNECKPDSEECPVSYSDSSIHSEARESSTTTAPIALSVLISEEKDFSTVTALKYSSPKALSDKKKSPVLNSDLFQEKRLIKDLLEGAEDTASGASDAESSCQVMNPVPEIPRNLEDEFLEASSRSSHTTDLELNPYNASSAVNKEIASNLSSSADWIASPKVNTKLDCSDELNRECASVEETVSNWQESCDASNIQNASESESLTVLTEKSAMLRKIPVDTNSETLPVQSFGPNTTISECATPLKSTTNPIDLDESTNKSPTASRHCSVFLETASVENDASSLLTGNSPVSDRCEILSDSFSSNTILEFLLKKSEQNSGNAGGSPEVCSKEESLVITDIKYSPFSKKSFFSQKSSAYVKNLQSFLKSALYYKRSLHRKYSNRRFSQSNSHPTPALESSSSNFAWSYEFNSLSISKKNLLPSFEVKLPKQISLNESDNKSSSIKQSSRKSSVKSKYEQDVPHTKTRSKFVNESKCDFQAPQKFSGSLGEKKHSKRMSNHTLSSKNVKNKADAIDKVTLSSKSNCSVADLTPKQRKPSKRITRKCSPSKRIKNKSVSRQQDDLSSESESNYSSIDLIKYFKQRQIESNSEKYENKTDSLKKDDLESESQDPTKCSLVYSDETEQINESKKEFNSEYLPEAISSKRSPPKDAPPLKDKLEVNDFQSVGSYGKKGDLKTSKIPSLEVKNLLNAEDSPASKGDDGRTEKKGFSSPNRHSHTSNIKREGSRSHHRYLMLEMNSSLRTVLHGICEEVRQDIANKCKKDNEIDWDVNVEVLIFLAMIGLKPVGVNKHFMMLLIHNKFTAYLNQQLSSKVIWDFLDSLYDMAALHESEIIPFPNEEVDFELPEDCYELLKSKYGISLKHSNSESEGVKNSTNSKTSKKLSTPKIKPSSTPVASKTTFATPILNKSIKSDTKMLSDASLKIKQESGSLVKSNKVKRSSSPFSNKMPKSESLPASKEASPDIPSTKKKLERGSSPAITKKPIKSESTSGNSSSKKLVKSESTLNGSRPAKEQTPDNAMKKVKTEKDPSKKFKGAQPTDSTSVSKKSSKSDNVNGIKKKSESDSTPKKQSENASVKSVKTEVKSSLSKEVETPASGSRKSSPVIKVKTNESSKKVKRPRQEEQSKKSTPAAKRRRQV